MTFKAENVILTVLIQCQVSNWTQNPP